MIILQLIVLGLLLYIIFLLSYSLIRGAPYAALSQNRISSVFELLSPQQGKYFLDLGSGDGRIVMAAAKLGMRATGYEINPLLVLISHYKLNKNSVKAHIELADFWKKDLSKFDYICVWGTQHMMPSLERKLDKELKKGTLIATNHFRFPNWKYVKKKNDVYLYVKR